MQGAVVTCLVTVLPAIARAQPDGGEQHDGSVPDGASAGHAGKVATNVLVQVVGSILPMGIVEAAMGPAPPEGANLAEWAAAA